MSKPSLFLIFSALCLSITIAAPVTNLTALQTEISPGWVADPSGRGTWSLLYSCLFTLLLCVYTAIHLNVPPPNETKFAFWLRKTKWVLIAVFAAELVVYTAFEQWFLARTFMKDINEAAAKNRVEKDEFEGLAPVDHNVPPKPPFDMVYAHYAVMGGFAADVTNLHNTLQRVTLTTQGILYLARHGIYLETSRSNIKDKSKADTLAKGLVCFQVLWIVGQAIERKAAGYPITLLEIHTIVHVVCVVVMYGLWIRKPLNIQDPTVIDLRDSSDILSFMLETSSPTGNNPKGFECQFFSGDKFNLDPTFLWYSNPQTASSDIEDTPYEVLSEPDRYTRTADHRILTKCDMKVGQSLACGLGPGLSDTPPITLNSPEACKTAAEWPPRRRVLAVSLSQADIDRLESIARFITKIIEGGYKPDAQAYSALGSSFYENTYTISQFNKEGSPARHGRNLLSLRAPNFDGSVLNNISTTSAYLATVMALIPTAYGCVHLGALSIIFPTLVERLLWKVSCYYLIATAGAIALFSFIIYAEELIWKLSNDRMNGTPISIARYQIRKIRRGILGRATDVVEDILAYSFFSIASLIFLLYVGARLYIVIEAFISLRHVPIGVYQTPRLNIMGSIPHL